MDVTLFQNLPTFGPALDGLEVAEVIAALGGGMEDVAPDLPAQVVSTGSPFLFVPVTSRRVVDDAPRDLAAIADLSQRHGALGVYVFAVEETAEAAGATKTWGRCFAPTAGLNEDPVTGSASGALGGYLARHGRLRFTPSLEEGREVARFVAQQGFAGGRGGAARIEIGRRAGKAAHIAVTGSAVLVAEGTFRLR